MATKTYAAMFEPTDGGFGISFPDLPGCVSFGEELEACMRNAEEALSLHLEGMAEDGDSYPDASHYGDLVGNINLPQGIVWASIKVEAPDAADRVNVYLPRSLLERIDRYVAEHAPMNRSTFFSEAARAQLGQPAPNAAPASDEQQVREAFNAAVARALDQMNIVSANAAQAAAGSMARMVAMNDGFYEPFSGEQPGTGRLVAVDVVEQRTLSGMTITGAGLWSTADTIFGNLSTTGEGIAGRILDGKKREHPKRR